MSQRVHKALTANSAARQKLWEDYHAGKITSQALHTGTLKLEARRQELAREALVPEYRGGEWVVSKWGERVEVEGPVRTEWGSLQYRVLKRGEVHDLWPAEVIVRKVPAPKPGTSVVDYWRGGPLKRAQHPPASRPTARSSRGSRRSRRVSD